MEQANYVGYEIKALSNLLRRKIWNVGDHPRHELLTEMDGMIVGFLCHNQDREIFQKDIETAFCIRGSTASRLLQRLEGNGFVARITSARDARLKQVVVTEKALALNQQLEDRISAVEAILTRDISPDEIRCFLSTVEKLKHNLK
jgi:DNA-binding MarR family transcriptional regulator